MIARPLLALLLVGCVGCAPRQPDCVEGEVSCASTTAEERCVRGTLLTLPCADGQACHAGLGCSVCDGSLLGCDGDDAVLCDTTGAIVEVVEHCARCIAGRCEDPCGADSLEAGVGCLYYATDLPQYGTIDDISVSTVAPSDQDFGIAIANPGEVPLDAVVEQNVAAPGTSPPTVIEVMRATVAPGGVEVLPLPQRELDGHVPGSLRNDDHASLLSSRAYRVRTTRPAMVYQFNPLANDATFSNDASLLVPVHAVGQVYDVIAWPTTNLTHLEMPSEGDPHPFLVIVGTQAGTRVRVRATADVSGGDGVPAADSGDALDFELGEFDTVSLRMTGLNDRRGDFTGTHVEATHPVAVFSGNECAWVSLPVGTGIERGACDHLEEQLLPRSTHGQSYVVVRSEPTESPPEPDVVRVLAMRDATEVTTSLPETYWASFTLDAGEWMDIASPRDFVLDASLPVIVAQFLLGAGRVDAAVEARGDPAFTLIPPLVQFSPQYTFYVPAGYAQNHVLLGVPTGITPLLDGVAPTDCTRTPIGAIAATTFDALRCPIAEGAHDIEASEPFSLVVQGRSAYASYGYAGGLNYAPVLLECNGDEDCFLGQICVDHVCTDPPF